jgi:hypothetical protein
MDLKLHRMIDLIKKSAVQKNRYSALPNFLVFFPLLIFILHICPGHLSPFIKAMDLKLHRMIDLIKQKCSVQEPVLCNSYISVITLY